jgi:hypothetical protein
MTPAPIANSNAVLRAPSGMENEVHSIPVLREHVEGHPCVSSAWRPDDYELMSLGQGGCVILTCMGPTMPPVIVRTTGPTCPVCSLEIKPGEELTEGEETVAHTNCLNITYAGMSEPERAALGVRALEKELSDALADDPDYMEIRPGVFASRDDVANCFAMIPKWFDRDEKAPAASGFYQVKNLDGSLSARLWDDGFWWHASGLDGFKPNISITHWLHIPLIHAEPVPAPNFARTL